MFLLLTLSKQMLVGFMVNFEHILHLVLLFLLVTLSRLMSAGIIHKKFEHPHKCFKKIKFPSIRERD